MTVTAAADALAFQGVFTLDPPSLLARTVREAGLIVDRSAAGHESAIGVRDVAARLGAEFPHVPAWALALLGGALLIPAVIVGRRGALSHGLLRRGFDAASAAAYFGAARLYNGSASACLNRLVQDPVAHGLRVANDGADASSARFLQLLTGHPVTFTGSAASCDRAAFSLLWQATGIDFNQSEGPPLSLAEALASLNPCVASQSDARQMGIPVGTRYAAATIPWRPGNGAGLLDQPAGFFFGLQPLGRIAGRYCVVTRGVEQGEEALTIRFETVAPRVA